MREWVREGEGMREKGEREIEMGRERKRERELKLTDAPITAEHTHQPIE